MWIRIAIVLLFLCMVGCLPDVDTDYPLLNDDTASEAPNFVGNYYVEDDDSYILVRVSKDYGRGVYKLFVEKENESFTVRTHAIDRTYFLVQQEKKDEQGNIFYSTLPMKVHNGNLYYLSLSTSRSEEVDELIKATVSKSREGVINSMNPYFVANNLKKYKKIVLDNMPYYEEEVLWISPDEYQRKKNQPKLEQYLDELVFSIGKGISPFGLIGEKKVSSAHYKLSDNKRNGTVTVWYDSDTVSWFETQDITNVRISSSSGKALVILESTKIHHKRFGNYKSHTSIQLVKFPDYSSAKRVKELLLNIKDY